MTKKLNKLIVSIFVIPCDALQLLWRDTVSIVVDDKVRGDMDATELFPDGG